MAQAVGNLLSRECKSCLNDQLIMKYDRFWDWELLSMNYDFSVDMLRMYFHRVHWSHILKRQQLPESFLREMATYFGMEPHIWIYVCRYQTLSESFIRDYSSKFDPKDLLLYQNVTVDFVRSVYGGKTPGSLPPDSSAPVSSGAEV